MDTIQLNKIYTLDNYSTIEVIKKTAKFIIYRMGYLQKADTNYDEYYRNRIYKIHGSEEMRTKQKLYVEDEGNEIYIKQWGINQYFKTNKDIRTYRIFNDNLIIERKLI